MSPIASMAEWGMLGAAIGVLVGFVLWLVFA
jgi:hypothetical protein